MELALKSTAMTALRGEQALVQAARRGDDRAFEQLYAQYRERITLFVHSKVRDHGRAEDISQEVFMAALRRLRSTDQPVAFKAWIFTIAKNACIDEFRRSARGREVGVKADDDFPTDQRASLSIVTSPPAAIESKQRLHDLRAAFRGLSQSHHRLLVMRELEGRSYDEIGNRLGMTRQGVESGLFRARRKLSEEYDELASGRRCEQVQTVVDSGAAFQPRQLGIKERRRLTLHLSECQACRRHARLVGIDETLLRPRSIAGKIAALVPFGPWGWSWRRGGSASAKAHASGHLAASGAAQAAGTAGASVTLGQAAATVAALAIAGAGGGIAIADHAHLGHGAPPAHHVTTSGAGGAGTGASATSAARSTAGSVRARSSSHSIAAQSSATGSKPGPAAVGAGRKHSGTNSSGSAGQPTTGGSGSATPSASAPSTTPSSGGPAKNLLNTTTNTPGQTLGKVTAPVKNVTNPVKNVINPVKNVTNPVKNVINPVIAPVKKVLSSPPVTSVTNPVTAPVKKVVTSPPVTSVTAPISTATNPVTSAPPVKKVGSTVGGAVETVVPPTSTDPSSGAGSSTGSSSSQSPITTAKKVLGGP